MPGRSFDCELFHENVSEGDLRRRFGGANVLAGPVPVGEGYEDDGTTLFPASLADQVTIVWKDSAQRRRPDVVRVRAGTSHWRTPQGIGIGTSLVFIERVNRRPFRLLGFHWDYGGTVMSWGGGSLAPADGRCWLRLRLTPQLGGPLAREVSGEREFSSAHPTMQVLNPRVYELFLAYDPVVRHGPR